MDSATSPAYKQFLRTIRTGLAVIHQPGIAPEWHEPEISGEGTLDSAFAVTDLALASIGAASSALAAYVGWHTGCTPAVHLDRRLASLWFDHSLRPVGWQVPAVRDSVTGDYRGRDGWIRIHANAPHHREHALEVLGAQANRTSVAHAVSDRNVQDIEEQMIAAGACAAIMRSPERWAVHPQGQALASEPLCLVEDGTASYTPVDRVVATSARPLEGLRVLDLTRVLAGPVSTRFLAGYGAQVLRIDPPSWTEPGMVPEVTLGKYCAGLDLRQPEDRRQFERLLAQADVLVHGYRPGALEGLGFGAQARQHIRPGLVDISLNAYGWSGPWAGRRGFDSLVQMSCGIAYAGMQWRQTDEPTPLPVQALDQATGYLLAAAALHGLIRRAETGQGSIVRLALARTAALLMSEQSVPGEAIGAAQGEDIDPWIEQTAWGPGQRLKAPCALDGIPMRWERPACVLRGDRAAAFFL